MFNSTVSIAAARFTYSAFAFDTRQRRNPKCPVARIADLVDNRMHQAATLRRHPPLTLSAAGSAGYYSVRQSLTTEGVDASQRGPELGASR